MSTFNKIYKKVANNGNSSDYQVVGQVGVNGVPLNIMKGASSSADGEIGLVPKPSKGNQNKYLRADGTWQSPPDTNTTYDVFTGTNNGLVPKTDNGTYFLTGNGSWGYPWVGSWSESGKTLICLGSGDDQLSKVNIPEASTSSNGLMSAKEKSIFDNILKPVYTVLAWMDDSFTIPNTVTIGTTRSFNQKITHRLMNDNGGREYKLFKNCIDNGYRVLYEPRFCGCSWGNIESFSNGENVSFTEGKENNTEYVDVTYYVKGTARNLSGADHNMVVKCTTDFYLSVGI